jgi:hypothetical protein
MESPGTFLLRTLEDSAALGPAVVALQFQAILANIGHIAHSFHIAFVDNVGFRRVIRADSVSLHACVCRQQVIKLDIVRTENARHTPTWNPDADANTLELLESRGLLGVLFTTLSFAAG